jgi:single-stranded DNA-binding protein
VSKNYSVIVPNALAEANVAGRVARKGDVRFTDAGTKVVNLTLAVSRRFQQNEEWKEKTAFVDVSIWGDAADRANTIRVGDVVLATFSLADMEARAFNKQDGATGTSLQVTRAQISRIAWPKEGEAEAAPVLPAEEEIAY